MSDTSSGIPYTKSRVTLTPDLAPRSGEQELSEDDAAKVLGARLGTRVMRSTTFGEDFRSGLTLPWKLIADHDRLRGRVTDQDRTQASSDLMVRIVRMLPPEARTESVLLNLDIRPILAEITQGSGVTRRNAIRYVNDVPVEGDEIIEAARLLEDENRRIEEQAVVVATGKEAAGEFGTGEEAVVARQQWIDERVNGWRQRNEDDSRCMGPTPQLEIAAQDEGAPAATREAAAEQLGSSSLYEQLLADAGMVSGTTQTYPFLSEDDVQWMFRMDMVQWQELLDSEKNKQLARAAGQDAPDDLMVDSGGLAGLQSPSTRVDTSSLSGIAAASTGQTGQGSTKVRMLDVFNSLYSNQRTTAELRNLQEKLILGGYLDEGDVRYWGKATDDATIKAWRTLVRDSVNLGKDMRSILEEAALAKAEEEEEESRRNQADLVLSSTVGVQTTADLLGQQVLGRTLSGDDHARIVEFIHGLERQQHADVAPEGMQETEAIDVEAEIEAYLTRTNQAEAGAYDMLEQMQAFQDFVRRPG